MTLLCYNIYETFAYEWDLFFVTGIPKVMPENPRLRRGFHIILLELFIERPD